MPGYLVHEQAVITCSHPPGKATPAPVNPRVRVMGRAIITQASQCTIAGCALSTTTTPPCATATWTSAATRVFANGQPVVLSDSKSNCLAPGTPLVILGTQTRVFGM